MEPSTKNRSDKTPSPEVIMVLRRIYPVEDCFDTIVSFAEKNGVDIYILDVEYIVEILLLDASGVSTDTLYQAFDIAKSYGLPMEEFTAHVNRLIRHHSVTLRRFIQTHYNPDTQDLRLRVVCKELFIVITKKIEVKPSFISQLKQSVENWDYVPEKYRLLAESYPDE